MNDPLGLNIDLNGISTATPVIPAGQQPFNIDTVTVEQSKSDPNKRNLKVKFTLAVDVAAADGGIISAGFPLTKYYPLQQSDNAKAPDFRRDLCVLVDAALKTDESTRPNLGQALGAIQGQTVMVNLAVEHDDRYGPQNRIGRLTPVA